MKTPFLIVAFLLASCFVAVAQDKQALETGMTKMYKNTVEANYDGMIEDTYPKIFEIAPKEKLREALQNMMNGDGYTMTVINTPPNFEYGPIKKIGEGSYCIVKHNLLMKMAFKSPISDEEKKTMTENFKTALQASEVTFDQKSNSFTINKRADVVAVANKLTNNQWKFINRGPTPLMEKLLDASVVKELGL